MYCPKCGTPNDSSVSICKNCGEVIQPIRQTQERYEPSGAKPADNLALAIVSTVVGFLCSCLGGIPGIVAIVFATQVNSKWSMGDFDGAESASKNAKLWSLVAFGITAAVFIFKIVAIVGSGILGSHFPGGGGMPGGFHL